ncbi:hypothetical protein GQ457_05G017300 [Hibiscus cannabinus]
MIIPGEKGPGNDIDIYLQPLMKELRQLWAGVQTFDVLKKENFNLRSALLWTINDFPAFANLSGWSTKGRYACPCCAAETCSMWLYNENKFSYMGHHQWLDENHRFRYDKDLFEGTEESISAPEQMSGSDIFAMLKQMKFTYGKMSESSNMRSKKKMKDVNDRASKQLTDEESDEEDDPREDELWKKKMSLQDPRYRYPRFSIGTLGTDTLNPSEYRYPRHEYRYLLHQKGSNSWKMFPTAPNNSQRSPTARYTIETIKQASKHQEKANASLINIHMMKICLCT